MGRARKKVPRAHAKTARAAAAGSATRRRAGPVAVLFSGGLDSAVLVADLSRRHSPVVPLFVRAGLVWEPAELRAAQGFLRAISRPEIDPLVVLRSPARELYGAHWSLGDGPAPGPRTPDEAVYLPGRNLLLLAAAAVWCVRHGITTLAMGTLSGNPFPDGTQAFFRAFTRVASLGMDRRFRVVAPFASLTKAEVIRRARGLPLHLTLSCLRPTPRGPCGKCNKCAERNRSLVRAARR